MAERIMALTLKQPWALAVAEYGKPVENRTWQTNYRGLLAIHAGASADRYASFPVRDAQRAYRAREAAALLAGRIAPEDRMGFRRLVAVARLAGIHHAGECADSAPAEGMLCSPWAFHGEWHWEFPDVWPLDPVACHPGRLGLWPLPDDVEKAVRAQLEEARRG